MSRDTEAGKYREKVAIESPTRSTNAYGEAVDTWGQIYTRNARIEGKQIDEVVNGERIRSVGTHQVWLRPYTPDLKTTMRIVWLSRPGRRTFDIVSCVEVGNREGNRLICKEQSS